MSDGSKLIVHANMHSLVSEALDSVHPFNITFWPQQSIHNHNGYDPEDDPMARYVFALNAPCLSDHFAQSSHEASGATVCEVFRSTSCRSL
jgi:hypothetical protein